MKKALLPLLFLGTSLFAEEKNDPSLLFKVDFDNVTVTAQHAEGEKKAHNFPESLALRMYTGPGGRENALTLNNKEALHYSNFKNFDPRKGTVSFWVASLNWKPSDPYFQIFFRSELSNGFSLLVYKFHTQSLLRFRIAQGKQEVGYVDVPLSNDDWTPGRWHKIDAVWDESQMALYLDGVLAKTLPYRRNPLKFHPKVLFPESMPGGTMALGENKNFHCDPTHSSAYDELEIYNRVLSPAEIRRNYEKFIPPADQPQRNELEVPRGSAITLDGELDPAEWQDAACIPLVNVLQQAIPGAGGKIYLKHDGKDFLLGAELAGGETQQVTGNDLVDIWRDDSFELHIFTAKKKRYQFILNSAGAMFDASMEDTNGMYIQSSLNPKWDSGARKAVRKGNGKWTLEMSIPRKNIDADDDSLLANFCATRYLEKASHAAWGMNCKNFFDETKFGLLHFAGAGKPVRLEKFGLRDGIFELQLNPEIPAWLIASDRKKSPRPSGKSMWQVELPAGIYDFAARAKHFYFASRVTVRQPLEIRYTCYASKNRLDAVLDAGGAGSQIRDLLKSGHAEAEVSLVSAEGETVLSEKTAMNDTIARLSLQFRKVPPQGTYALKAVILDNGKPAITASRSFRVPDMTPYREKIAANHTVPLPWTPVEKLDSRRFRVWNRIYTFESGPFPSQIETAGEKMFSSGPVLLLDGVPVKWNSFEQTEQFDDEIHFTGTGSAGGLAFRWESALCFDGLVKIRITMAPENGREAELKKLNLQWSVPQEYARAMLDPLYSPWRNKDGEIYRFSYQHGADFIIWTTGIDKGLMWWIESSANWKNPAGYKPFTMAREKDSVTVTADFITEPSVLRKQADYFMAFMATPGRPEPERRRDFNPGQAWDVLKYESVKVQYFGISATPVDYATEPWTGLIPLDPDKFRKHIEKLEKQGTHFMPYSQPLMTASIEESYDWFFPEWKQIPGFPSAGPGIEHKTGKYYVVEGCCGGTGAEDLFVWRADKIMKDYPTLPGIYYDIANGDLCSNHLHGCGGIDAFGKNYASSNLMKLRGYYIRLKRVLISHGKDKILFLHAHNRFVPFAQGIADYWYPGEQYSDDITRNMEHFYCEEIPLEEYQSAYYTPVKGTGIVFLPTYQITQWRLKMKKKYAVPQYAFSQMTPLLLHDTNMTNCYLHHKTVEHWWIIKHDVNLADAEFHGYWFSDAVKPDGERIYCSWYSWKNPSPYSRMLVVGNLSRKDQTAELTVDWGKMGIDPASAEFTDLWTGEPVQDIRKLEVKSNNFRLIGIKEK